MVKFKQDGRVEKVPTSWAELISSNVAQARTTGLVKKPIGKVRDVALLATDPVCSVIRANSGTPKVECQR